MRGTCVLLTTGKAMKGRFIVPLWTDIRASGRLRLLHEDWGLVGAGSPACRHGDVQHAQIDAKLAAVLIPVAEHDVAQELAARLSEDLAAADGQSPAFAHAGIVSFRKRIADGGDTFIEGFQDFLAAGRLGEIEIG